VVGLGMRSGQVMMTCHKHERKPRRISNANPNALPRRAKEYGCEETKERLYSPNGPYPRTTGRIQAANDPGNNPTT